MEEVKFSLSPIHTNGIYEVQNYELLLEQVQDYINKCDINLEIMNNDDLKVLKEKRTELRKKLEAITDTRLNINKYAFGKFNDQLKELERLLKDADNKLKENKETFEKANGKIEKPKAIQLIIKSYDDKVIEKIKAYASKYNVEINVK